MLGFVLARNPDHQEELSERVVEEILGLESLMGDNLQALVNGRVAAGVIGPVGLLWSGSGITEAAGYALGRVFRVEQYRTFVKRKLWSLGTTATLGVLGLLGLGAVATVGNLPVSGAAGSGLRSLGLLVGYGIDVLVFAAAYRLLKLREGPAVGELWKGALLSAAGWNVLKVVGTWYVARTISDSSAVYGTFASRWPSAGPLPWVTGVSVRRGAERGTAGTMGYDDERGRAGGGRTRGKRRGRR